MAGEFVLSEWAAAGLNVVTAVKRGVYTVHEGLVIKVIGQLSKYASCLHNHSLGFVCE